MANERSRMASERLAQHLRGQGVRVTPQRLLVLEALAALGGHRTAEELQEWMAVRYPAMNLATVYRTLDLLLSIGLVAQTDLGGGAASYELVGDVPHHHLVCERCGAITEMEDSLFGTMRDALLDRYGFEVRSRHLAIFGLCRACRAAQ